MHIHDGVIESDTEKLQIECNEYVIDRMVDPVFVIMGKPRICGFWNGCLGRKIKKKKERKGKNQHVKVG